MPPVDAPVQARADLNFAANRDDGGIWSNGTPEITTQVLAPHSVGFRDARHLRVPPSVDREGFEIAHAPVGSYAWHDDRWVADVYMPHCVALVRKVTGADHVAAIQKGVLIRDTGDVSRAPAAQFVHIDQDRGAAQPMLLEAAGSAQELAKYKRRTIYNVWRSVTPPPQDMPLALCDQRTVDEVDWVVGKTIEPNIPYPIPYVSSVYNAGHAWYYYSDMSLDEALVFKNYDDGAGQALGCLHGAFKLADVAAGAAPRASAETRIAAFFIDA